MKGAQAARKARAAWGLFLCTAKSFLCLRNRQAVFVDTLTIRKCAHGLYWPADHEKAYSCCFCNPDLLEKRDSAPAERIPLFTKRARDFSEVPPANKNSQALTRCPKCQSNVHYILESGTLECADCGDVWPGPKRKKEYADDPS